MQQVNVEELRRGKSLGRTLLNLRLQGIHISGNGIDLGAKSGDASYYRFLGVAPGTHIIFTDLIPTDPRVLRLDLEKTFPVASQSQDFLLLFNVLEHLYDHRACLAECYRILRSGGRLIGSVPFLVAIHPDPDDHWRYSHSTLWRLLTEAGFAHCQVEALGYGPCAAAYSLLQQLLRPRSLSVATARLAIGVDTLLAQLRPDRRPSWSETYPLSYFFVATK